MDALKGLLKAMSANFDRALGQQNVRIRDMDSNQKTFGVVFTVLGIFIGIAGIFSISGRVRSQTEEASEKWFDKNADDLKKQINSFEQELYLLKKQTEQHAEKVSDEMSEMSKILQKDLANKTIDPNSKESDQTVALTDKESKTLSDSETELQSKPESSYTFNDWNTRAFSAYYGQKLNDAAFYWDKATKLSNASKKQISRALFNKGYALTQLERINEAIAVYDDIIKRYDNNELRALCATALGNAAELYLSLNRHKDVIKAIDQAMLRVEKNMPGLATLTFLQWLVGVRELQSVVSAIKTLDETVHFNCSFELLRPWAKKSLDRQQQQAECLMAFFEQHQDIQQLEQCLENS